ncbi:protein of unknown function (DUF4333) [Parafrankia irregularis]|uniref:DUF4333 domain-containing protein n=1 Tax=Parafrankia irregularis TaxID=795642 RepID=A0A0S4QG62_9ACTN|nr:MULTISPECIES: DUF4333 domain-containing protein [Parafrankia]MBE3200965.1 DUF4333 domain-containing protein [Parafrankia sp. CH37]CUU54635.1 protein of unknown function (DUF4333) [Parafrankia irregularis]
MTGNIRTTRRGARFAVVGGGLLAALLLVGCEGSVSLGGREVASGDVEQEIVAKFGALFPGQNPAVDCPDSLRAEVGTTMQCQLTDPGDGTTYPVNVTVNTVDGADTKFGLDLVGLTAVSEEEVEQQIMTNFGSQFDRTDLAVDCPSALRAKAGATLQCTLTDPADSTSYPVNVTVDGVDGDSTSFSFELGDAKTA